MKRQKSHSFFHYFTCAGFLTWNCSLPPGDNWDALAVILSTSNLCCWDRRTRAAALSKSLMLYYSLLSKLVVLHGLAWCFTKCCAAQIAKIKLKIRRRYAFSYLIRRRKIRTICNCCYTTPEFMEKQTCPQQTRWGPQRTGLRCAFGHKDWGQTSPPRWLELSKLCVFELPVWPWNGR